MEEREPSHDDDPTADESPRDDQPASVDENELPATDATSTSELNHQTGHNVATRVSARRAAIISLCVFGCAFVLLNLPYQFVDASTFNYGTAQTPVDFSADRTAIPRMAGWPYRYWVAYPSDPDLPATSTFASMALLYNLAAAIIPFCIVSYYFYRRTLRVASGRLKGRRVTIGDMLAITFTLAVLLSFWRNLSTSRDAEAALAREIELASGSVIVQSWAPAFVANWIPQAVLTKLERIRLVRLESPTDSLLKKIIKRPTLTTLRLGGSDYDLRVLDDLHHSPFVCDLRIAGRTIDGELLHSLTSHPRLRTLNLMRTNVSSEALSILDQAPGLRRLGLIETPVELQSVAHSAWCDRIEELWLPRPSPGVSDSLTIDGWPQLRSLQVNDLDAQPNAAVVKLTLSNLPQLETLGIDVLQKFDLTLHQLPKLRELNELDFQWDNRRASSDNVPAHAWIAGIDFDELPELSGEFKFFGVDLAAFRLRQVPKLTALEVVAIYRAATTSESPVQTVVPAKAAQALVQGLGEGDVPARIVLNGFDLTGVDLAKLNKNSQLRELAFSRSKIPLAALKTLDGVPLTRLDLKSCAIENQGIQWLLQHMPDLQHFAYSPSPDLAYSGNQPETLSVINHPNLKTLDLGDLSMRSFEAVRIVDSPSVQLELNLSYVQDLELRGSPAISGLSIDGPLPDNAKLADLNGLRFLAVGGPNVNDALIDAIKNGTKLETLTLAYPSVSADALKQLKQIGSLKVLSLPGSNLDDSVVESWPTLSNLEFLNVSDTNITSDSVKKLLASERLKQVRLDRTKVSIADLAPLANLPLTELHLAGIGIDPATLTSIVENGQLTHIDLSFSKLTPEVFDALLGDAGRLRHLSLRECNVDSDKIIALANQNRQLMFDLTGSDATTELQTALLSAGRVESTNGTPQQMMMMGMMMGVEDAVQQKPEIIQVDAFAPPPTMPGNTSTPTTLSPPQADNDENPGVTE